MKFDYENPAKTREEAEEKWPECTFIAEVEGGWAGFLTLGEFLQWKGQK